MTPGSSSPDRGWRDRLAAFDADDVVLILALVLLAIGGGLVWLPAAFLAPGLVLLWLVLPSRAPFIARTPLPSPDATTRHRRTT